MPRSFDTRELFRRPLVVAPMAGGPSTVELVTEATRAGALGFLAGGYKTAMQMLEEIAAVRAATTEAFGVNIFVPGSPSEPGPVARYLESLAAEAGMLGAELGAPRWDDDGWEEKLDALLEVSPPVVSFTFGCPSREVCTELGRAGSVVVVTVTSAEEAIEATRAGAQMLCTQGFEAGAHRGTFTNAEVPDHDTDLLALLAEVSRVTALPQIAAGGMVQAQQVKRVLIAGAVAAQCGTAFLRCPESGAHPAYKAALADPRFKTTAVTRAFSGRPARSLVNRFVSEHSESAPAAYPELNNATRPLRAAAARRGDAQSMSLYAGRGFRAATDRPVAEVVDLLCM